MRPSATLNRDSLGLLEGLRSPAPTLTLYLCKELFVVLLGGRQGGAKQASLSQYCRGGRFDISTSGLLNIYIYMLCYGFLAYMEGTVDPWALSVPQRYLSKPRSLLPLRPLQSLSHPGQSPMCLV